MAKRTVYGKSPWGAYFIETLLSHYDDGRLQRGRSYANTGKVAKLIISGPTIAAKVAGNYKPWYKVFLQFPAFSSEERGAVVGIIKRNPAYLSAVAAGMLPMELINELKKKKIDLLPRDWGKLQRGCNCPDYGDPCKHMAAVYYTMVHEIDQNPFAIFLLRGLDLRAEFFLAQDEAVPEPFVLRKREKDAPISSAEPDIALTDNYVSFVLSVLRPSPPFYNGDFKTLLAEFHHRSARRYEALLTIGAEGGRHLAESTFALQGADAPSGFGPWPKLASKHPVSGAAAAELLDLAPAFLLAEESAGTESYRFFFYLYRLFFLILRSGAFLPAVEQRGDAFRVLWKPLSSVPDVSDCLDALAALCPPLLSLPAHRSKVAWADGRSTTEYLLAALCTQYVRRLAFACGTARGGDPVEALFFAGAILDAKAPAHRSTPRAIHAWLAVHEPVAARYRYRFTLKTSERAAAATKSDQTYRLSVALAKLEAEDGDKASADSSLLWVPLHRAAVQSEGAEILSFAVMLSSFLPELEALAAAASVSLAEDRLLFFLTEAAPVLRRLRAEVLLPKELGKVLKPRLTVAAKLKGAGNLESRLGLEAMLDFTWSVVVGETTYSLAEFERLLKRGKRIVRLKDGFLSLDADELRRLLDRTVRAPGAGDAVAAFLDGGEAFDARARRACEKLFREKDLRPPRGLTAELRPYQRSGYRWAWNNLVNGFGCLLADDMGLGKTVQAIAVTQKLKEENRLEGGALAVVPASLMVNWKRELSRFAPELRVADYYGPRRKLDGDADIHLSTYETVQRDREKLADRGFSLLILDEAHSLKNAASKRAQGIRSLNAGMKLALSGTPVENRLEDLRAVFDLVLPGYLGDAAAFRTAWRVPIELHRDAEAAAALKRITAPFLLRRLKTDEGIAPELPPKTTIDEFATLTVEQAALYESALAELAGKEAGLDDPAKRSALVLKLLTALKQICNHPRAYDGESPADAARSGKTMLLLDLLRSILDGGEKVLVFSQYVETLGLLEGIIRKELGEASLILHGGMGAAARTQAVDRFQNDPAYRIFLVSLKAGGVGLNLTAASRVIHYDLWFNPAVENQASDRVFRIGQERRVFVHRLIAAGTFEEKIDALIKSKRELADLSVPQGESWLADLEGEDLRALFSRDRR